MTPEEREHVDRLVEEMKTEKNQAKFADPLRQFQEIISRKLKRLERPEQTSSAN
jgi:non-homologous end joining protein Ku